MAKKIRKFFHRLGENRTLLLGVVFLAMFAVLIGRLFILQVVHGEEYADNFELQITKESCQNQKGKRDFSAHLLSSLLF